MNNLTAAYSRDAAYKLRDLTDHRRPDGQQARRASSHSRFPGATATKAYDTIVDLATALDKQNVPDAGRWVIVNPDLPTVCCARTAVSSLAPSPLIPRCSTAWSVRPRA